MVLQAVLFDFDGVIADTANVHVVAWQRTLAALGWRVTDEVAARAAEVDDRAFLSDLFEKRGVESDGVDEWVRRKQVLTVELLKHSPRLHRGVTEVVGLLRGWVRMAVVSGTWRENIEAVLEGAGLASAFELIVGKEDVTARKPDPEAYEQALSRLGVHALEAVALEDSPTGMASAKSAGVPVIAVGHHRAFGEWVGDSKFVAGFEPVEGLLERLGI
jgi:beta-phosphoglucomutase